MAKWRANEKHKKINSVLDILSAIIIIGFTVYTFIAWTCAPYTIPTHFNIQGQVDAYGSKNTLFLLVGIAIALYLFMYLISRHPDIGNYIVKIHDGNREAQYNMMSTFVKVLNLELSLMFALMQIDIVKSAINNGSGISPFTTLLPIAGMIISVIIYGRWSLKCK
ncbi:MAG: DUF1648 domain-containing protein [Sarcina sp.]